MLKNIKAVIFDLDGTLADSMWIWKEIDIRFLRSRNLPFPEDLQREIEGLSMRETAVYFRRRFYLQDTEEELMAEWNRMAFSSYASEISLKAGAESFLKQLKQCGISTGIATSNSPELTETFLKAAGIRYLIDCVVTANEVAKGKPSPDVYLLAKDKLGVRASDCLVFEDIPAGIAAGKAAGMKVCAVYDDYSKDVDQMKRSMADFYITDFISLTEREKGGKEK